MRHNVNDTTLTYIVSSSSVHRQYNYLLSHVTTLVYVCPYTSFVYQIIATNCRGTTLKKGRGGGGNDLLVVDKSCNIVDKP